MVQACYVPDAMSFVYQSRLGTNANIFTLKANLQHSNSITKLVMHIC